MAESLGDILRAAREEARQSTSEVGAATNIKVQIIEDLESNEFHRISAPIYAKGFIRLYADHLGLDPQPLVALYVAQHDAPAPPPTLMANEGKKGRRKPKKPKPAKDAPAQPAQADLDLSSDGAPSRKPAQPPAATRTPRRSDDHANLLADTDEDADELRNASGRQNERWRKSPLSGLSEKVSEMARALPVNDLKERFSRDDEDAPAGRSPVTAGGRQRLVPTAVGLVLLVIVLVSVLSRCSHRDADSRGDEVRRDGGAMDYELTHDLPEPYAE